MSTDKYFFFNKLSALARIFENAPSTIVEKTNTLSEVTFLCKMKSGEVFVGKGSSESIAAENAYEQAYISILSRISSADVHDGVSDDVKCVDILVQGEPAPPSVSPSSSSVCAPVGATIDPIKSVASDVAEIRLPTGRSISAINDCCQRNKIVLPVYSISWHDGKAHTPEFKGTASWLGVTVTCTRSNASKQIVKSILADLLVAKVQSLSLVKNVFGAGVVPTTSGSELAYSNK